MLSWLLSFNYSYKADDMYTCICIWKEHKLNSFVINQIKNDLTIDATFVYLQEMDLFWIFSNELGLHEKSALTSRLSKDRYHVHYIVMYTVIHSWHYHDEWKVNVCVHVCYQCKDEAPGISWGDRVSILNVTLTSTKSTQKFSTHV